MTQQPTTEEQTWHTSTLTVPKHTPWWRKPVTAIATGTGIVALAAGIALGGLAAHTPDECRQALDYAEQAMGQSAEGMGALGDAADGGYSSKLRAINKLDGVTAELKRLTPLYKDAKAACLK